MHALFHIDQESKTNMCTESRGHSFIWISFMHLHFFLFLNLSIGHDLVKEYMQVFLHKADGFVRVAI